MSDESALVRAIVESPDDLALRMIYADWCEEHGRSARSALVRGQCFLETALSSNESPLYHIYPGDPRLAHSSVLTQELREDLLVPLRPFYTLLDRPWDVFTSTHNDTYIVRRGFIERLRLDSLEQAHHWVQSAAAVLAQLPLRSLALSRPWGGRSSTNPVTLPAELLAHLLAVEGIERLETIDLGMYVVALAGAEILLARARPWLGCGSRSAIVASTAESSPNFKRSLANASHSSIEASTTTRSPFETP